MGQNCRWWSLPSRKPELVGRAAQVSTTCGNWSAVGLPFVECFAGHRSCVWWAPCERPSYVENGRFEIVGSTREPRKNVHRTVGTRCPANGTNFVRDRDRVIVDDDRKAAICCGLTSCCFFFFFINILFSSRIDNATAAKKVPKIDSVETSIYRYALSLINLPRASTSRVRLSVGDPFEKYQFNAEKSLRSANRFLEFFAFSEMKLTHHLSIRSLVARADRRRSSSIGRRTPSWKKKTLVHGITVFDRYQPPLSLVRGGVPCLPFGVFSFVFASSSRTFRYSKFSFLNLSLLLVRTACVRSASRDQTRLFFRWTVRWKRSGTRTSSSTFCSSGRRTKMETPKSWWNTPTVWTPKS